MTDVPNGFESQTRQPDVVQVPRLEEANSRKTLLLLGLLAATGAAWWTMQDRSDVAATAPPLASNAPVSVPVDEATIATEGTSARIAPAPAKAQPRVPRDRDPRLIASSQVMPRYPAAALRTGQAGTVMVAATIDANGVPVDVSIDDRSGSRELDRSAMQAVRQWRFQPALRNGKPVQASVRVPVEFALQNS